MDGADLKSWSSIFWKKREFYYSSSWDWLSAYCACRQTAHDSCGMRNARLTALQRESCTVSAPRLTSAGGQSKFSKTWRSFFDKKLKFNGFRVRAGHPHTISNVIGTMRCKIVIIHFADVYWWDKNVKSWWTLMMRFVVSDADAHCLVFCIFAGSVHVC